MNRRGWTILGCGLFVCAVSITTVLWLYSRKAPEAPVVSQTTTTSPDVDPSSISIYTSGEYGFAFFYPSNAVLHDAFTASSSDDVSWREGATANGTPIVQVATVDGEVRIGQSSEQRELQACTQEGPSERSLGPSTIGSTTWSTFSFEKLGTDDEADVTSYRALRNNVCVALEVLKPGIPTTETVSFSVDSIVQSFSFAQ